MKRKQLGLIVVALVIALASGLFLKDTAVYIFYSQNIEAIESDAKEGDWINGRRVIWSPEKKELYNNAVNKKNQFIASSDIAQFLYDCGNSITGQILRAVDIMLIAAIFIFSLEVAFELTKRVIKSLFNSAKKKVRNIAKCRCH